MKRTVYTEEQRVQMKEMYLKGLSASEIAREMKTDVGTLRREIKTMVTLRGISETRRMRMGIKYVRSDAFDILTPEALYWIGFLYADGYIQGDHPVISLGIAEIDRGHLDKLNEFLGGQLNIATIVQSRSRTLKGQKADCANLVRLKVADIQLYNRLKELGFTPKKTHTIVPHDLLKYSRDFWRGMIDGDGWLTYSNTVYKGVKKDIHYKYPKVGLCGNEKTIEEFLNFIKVSGIECKSQVKKAPRENGLYSMDSAGEPTIKICNLLYKDATVYLDRKHQKYLEFITEKE
jgi:hypothetical protein